jgi:hypothetical protein
MKIEELLELAIKDEGNAARVARKIGYSKTIVSLIQKGKYDAGLQKFGIALRKAYSHLISGQIMCPGVRSEIHAEICRKYRKAVKQNKPLKDTMFLLVKDMCPYCPMIKGDKNDSV